MSPNRGTLNCNWLQSGLKLDISLHYFWRPPCWPSARARIRSPCPKPPSNRRRGRILRRHRSGRQYRADTSSTAANRRGTNQIGRTGNHARRHRQRHRLGESACMSVPRVVLDTNCLVSALIFSRGRFAWLREAWQAKRFIAWPVTTWSANCCVFLPTLSSS